MLHSKEKSKRIVRGFKTLFFIIYIIISFLLFSAPLLVSMADALLPTALLSASFSTKPLSPQNLICDLQSYDFRYSLVDIPFISIIRSAIIICVYSLCDGPALSRWPYMWITMLSSVLSLVFVSIKASFFFSGSNKELFSPTEVAMFASSVSLAVGHAVVAYRTSCRERRKLLIYKIDIEAISACKNGFPTARYQKIVMK